MGRRTRLESPDSGVQITHYNTTTGQLDYTQNSVLIEKGQKIVYQYDEFGRLKKIVYPDNKQLDNTEYEYDENDQIVKKIDNSGEHYYQYGKLGEIVSETIKQSKKYQRELNKRINQSIDIINELKDGTIIIDGFENKNIQDYIKKK